MGVKSESVAGPIGPNEVVLSNADSTLAVFLYNLGEFHDSMSHILHKGGIRQGLGQVRSDTQGCFSFETILENTSVGPNDSFTIRCHSTSRSSDRNPCKPLQRKSTLESTVPRSGIVHTNDIVECQLRSKLTGEL